MAKPEELMGKKGRYEKAAKERSGKDSKAELYRQIGELEVEKAHLVAKCLEEEKEEAGGDED